MKHLSYLIKSAVSGFVHEPDLYLDEGAAAEYMRNKMNPPLSRALTIGGNSLAGAGLGAIASHGFDNPKPWLGAAVGGGIGAGIGYLENKLQDHNVDTLYNDHLKGRIDKKHKYKPEEIMALGEAAESSRNPWLIPALGAGTGGSLGAVLGELHSSRPGIGALIGTAAGGGLGYLAQRYGKEERAKLIAESLRASGRQE
jgi:hypothetical protein